MQTLRPDEEGFQGGDAVLESADVGEGDDDVAEPEGGGAGGGGPSDGGGAEPLLFAVAGGDFVQEERVRALAVRPVEAQGAELAVGGEGVQPVVQDARAGAPVFLAASGLGF